VAMAAQIAPEHAEPISAAAAERIRAGGLDGIEQLNEAILAAEARETVAALAKLAKAVEAAQFRTLFESLAAGQTRRISWQLQGWRELRNSATAYGVLDHEQAVAFYRSLLKSSQPAIRGVGVYGCGELRVAEAVPELLTVVVPEDENCMVPSAVCVALGKIGTPSAHEALAGLLSRAGLPENSRLSIMTVMSCVCGHTGIRGPDGIWENGTWYSVTLDPAGAELLARACDSLEGQAVGDRVLSRARHTAEMLRRGPRG